MRVQDRPSGGINHEKAPFAKPGKHLTNLLEIIDFVKPTALIGAAAQGKQFTVEVIKKMCALNERPIIFALSNPTSKAECNADDAYSHTDGKLVYATGSTFPNYDYKGKVFHPGQGNNCKHSSLKNYSVSCIL